MKKISISIFAVLSLIATASCNKEQFAETSSTTDAALVVSANQAQENDQDSKLFLTSPWILKFVSNDRLIGFNTEGNKYVSEVRGGTGVQPTADFHFNEWSGTPSYFMFNFDGSNTNPYADAALSDGYIYAKVGSEQKPLDVKTSICRWGPVTVGVATNIGTVQEPVYTTSLKNVTGFVKVAFVNSKIQSLAISSVEGVDLAGLVKIATSSVDDGEPVATMLEGAKTITLMPTGDAGHDEDSAEEGKSVKCFNNSSDDAYYISILPGTFTPVLTFTDNLGRTVTKTAASPITVKRSELYDLKVIDVSVIFDESLKLPETLTFTLGKEWNFKEAAPVQGHYEGQAYGNRGKNFYGETYNYVYEDEQTGFKGTYPFQLCRHYNGSDVDTDETNRTGYYYDSATGINLLFHGACLTFPAIPSYKLTRVELNCTKASKLVTEFLHSSSADNAILKAFEAGEDYCDLDETLCNTHYFLFFHTSSKIVISNLKLVYTKEDTVEAIQLGFDYPLEGEVDVKNVFTGIATSSGKAADTPFTQNGYTFTPNTGSAWYWNASSNKIGMVTNGSAPMWLKLPKIAGYRLSKVKLGTTQTSAKKLQISYAMAPVSAVGDMTVVAEATLSASESTLVLNDAYDPAKDYYYVVRSTSAGVRKFLLTYRPL